MFSEIARMLHCAWAAHRRSPFQRFLHSPSPGCGPHWAASAHHESPKCASAIVQWRWNFHQALFSPKWFVCNGSASDSSTNLVAEHATGSYHFFKDVFAHMWVHGTQWVIKEVDIRVTVHSPGKADSLLLTTTQVDTLYTKVDLWYVSARPDIKQG